MEELEEIEKTFNAYWKTIPEANLPKYNEFNFIIPVGENKENLRILESLNDKIGVANFDKPNEGITSLSLIATFSDLLCNKRFAAVLEDDDSKAVEERKIIGWKFID